jgi:hypothetical protein
MRTAFLLSLTLTAALFAADPQSQPAKDPDRSATTDVVQKLGSVTWDLKNHKLAWVVQKGAMVNGEFKPASEQRFEISPDEAVMAAAGEKRGFDETEASSLHQLLDVLSLYCAESVVWWNQGEGTPVEDGPKPATKEPEQKPVRVGQPDQQKPKPAPQRIVPDTELVARAAGQ